MLDTATAWNSERMVEQMTKGPEDVIIKHYQIQILQYGSEHGLMFKDVDEKKDMM